MSKKICVSVGHGKSKTGGFDPGACYEGRREFNIAKEIAKYLAEYLRTAGFEVRIYILPKGLKKSTPAISIWLLKSTSTRAEARAARFITLPALKTAERRRGLSPLIYPKRSVSPTGAPK